MTVTTSQLHRGERDISRKAIAQGMSECFRCPVCSCAPKCTFLAHETAGAARTRHFLRPLFEEAQRICKSSGETRRENAKAWDIVSRALRSMERLRNDALQTRDPGVRGQSEGSQSAASMGPGSRPGHGGKLNQRRFRRHVMADNLPVKIFPRNHP